MYVREDRGHTCKLAHAEMQIQVDKPRCILQYVHLS